MDPCVVTLARQAMATRFELVLHGEDAVRLRAAGEEALAEVDRLEAQLSLFRSSSEVAHLNACAAREPVRVTPELFALLERAKKLTAETGGAFDITVAPLMRLWGFIGGSGRVPDLQALEDARARVGVHLVELNQADRSVHFARSGVMLDLGAIGKGYAIERAADVLAEAGVQSALLHGGTSTVYGLGHPPDAEAWQVALPVPPSAACAHSGEIPSGRIEFGNPAGDATGSAPENAATIPLRDQALSVSAVWGKYFHSFGQEPEKPRMVTHVLDPRTGCPAEDRQMAVVVLPSATDTDALSTALLVGGPGMLKEIADAHPGFRGLVVTGDAPPFRVEMYPAAA
jgi:FAD:protein FMN transferase